MAAVSKTGTPSISTSVPPTNACWSGFYAGEALGAGDPCYIKTSDGKVYKSDGTSANAAAVVDGYPPTDCPIGEATSLYAGVTFRYGASLSPGSFVYLAAGGGLADAASTGGT